MKTWKQVLCCKHNIHLALEYERVFDECSNILFNLKGKKNIVYIFFSPGKFPSKFSDNWQATGVYKVADALEDDIVLDSVHVLLVFNIKEKKTNKMWMLSTLVCLHITHKLGQEVANLFPMNSTKKHICNPLRNVTQNVKHWYMIPAMNCRFL